MLRPSSLLLAALGLLLAALPTLAAPASEKAPLYAIEQMKDNVYRFSAGPYRSAFMVTEAGIVLTDPLDPAAAKWLKAQLAERFGVPVRYMIYSHNHVDHTAGGAVFEDPGVTVIAQERAAEDLRWTKVPTALPAVTFGDHARVDLGGSYVLLRHHGPNNGRGSVSMRFMPANVLYVVDWIVLGRMPYRDLLGYDIHGMIRSTREVLAEPPFDLFVGGHAEAGSRADVERYLAYLEALYGAVRDGMVQGKNLATLQAEVELPAFADLKMYREWLPLNVKGVYDTLVRTSYFNFRGDLDATF